MNKSRLIAVVLLLAAGLSANAQRYSDIYNSLPDKTLDQAYSLLLNFQRTDPYWANTYVQLGMVCEQKMLTIDPLRDIQTAQYWADNAKLFFETFGAFYTDGDVRSNSVYYRNLDIPATGGRVSDEDLKAFVQKHLAFCRNFRDSTTLAYQALEESKDYYNKCIGTFLTICNDYGNLNEMLLRHDAALAGVLGTLAGDIDRCVEAFARYKQVIAAYPIRDYKQVYDFKTIETFRLDGLTNSDFYMDRFSIWDYRSWIDMVNQTLEADILPLRKRVADINNQYAQGRKEYLENKPFEAAAQEAYDELFIFQLGKYDNNSLVRELFAYLDNTRQLMLLAHDSLVLSPDSSAALMNRKMRHIYRLSEQFGHARQALAGFGNSVTPERVARFADFFEQNYGGQRGLEKYVQTEADFLSGILGAVLDHFDGYVQAVDRQRARPAYSARGKNVAVPLWVVAESDLPSLQGNYVTTHVVYDVQGKPEFVAGKKKNAADVAFVAKIDGKNATAWLAELKNTQQIYNISANGSGCLVAVNQGNSSAVVFLNQDGKEARKLQVAAETPVVASYDDLANITYVAYSEPNGGTRLRRIDDVNVWTAVLKSFSRVESIVAVDGGILVVGYNNACLACGRISSDGRIEQVKTIGAEGMALDRIFRASAQDICLFTRDAQGRLQLTTVSDKGEVKITSVR